MLTIFKGDDTGGAMGHHISVKVESDFSITGCTVVFVLCGYKKEFTGLASGDEIDLFFSHNDTRTFPVGVHKAALYVVDSSGKIRTLTNSLAVKVTTNVTECYGADAQQATVRIFQTVDWDGIKNKPFVGQTVNLRTDDEVLAALGTIIEKLGGTVNA